MNKAEITRVEGAASAIINYLVAHFSYSYEEIHVDSLESAKSFYQKLGFKVVDQIYGERGTIPMLLRLKKNSP